MSEWAARLGLLFPDRARAEFDLFNEEVNSDNAQRLSFLQDFNEDKETKPSYEQISQERILDEANKNIQILKSLETILQERTQSYSTFFAAQGKDKSSFEIFQYCEGTLRQALDALFVFLEQELQQARQQQTLGDLRKALSEVKLNAQKRLLDYQREVNTVDKEVAIAEKKLAKSKECLEKVLEQKHRLESGECDQTTPNTRRPLAITRYNSHRGDINKQEKLKECLESIAKSDKDIKEGIQNLLKALYAKDQVLVASRRAYQKLDKDCKKAVAVTFRKLIIREREAATARETVLAKLESAVDEIDVDGDLTDFIVQHRQGDEGSLHLCVQALKVLGDLVPLEGQVLTEPMDLLTHSVSSRSTSGDKEELHSYTPPHGASYSCEETPSSPLSDNSSQSKNNSGKETRREFQKVAYNAPTPIALASTTSSTLSYAVNKGLPIAEAFASIVSMCTGEPKKVPQECSLKSDVSSGEIVDHLTKIFYCHWSPSTSSSSQSIPTSSSGLSSGSGKSQTLFLDFNGATVDDASSSSENTENNGDNDSHSNSENKGHSDGENDGNNESTSCMTECINGKIFTTAPESVTLSTSTSSDLKKEKIPRNANIQSSCLLKSSDSRDFLTEHFKTENSKIPDKKNQSFRENNILGTNIATDFYSSSETIGKSIELNSSIKNSDDDCKYACSSDLEDSANFLCEVVKSQKGRDAFIVQLNQFRSKKVEIGAGYVILGIVLWDVLDRCKEDNDVHTAKVVMMLSQTFYRRLNQFVRKKKKRKKTDHMVILPSRDIDLFNDISFKKPDKIIADSDTYNADLNTKVTEIKGKSCESCDSNDSSNDTKSDTKSDDKSDDKSKDESEDNSEDESENSEDDEEEEEEEESNDVGEDDRISDRGSGKREYLKATLLAHDIWKDKSFWEQALWQCTVEQLHTIPYERAWHDLTEEERLDPVRRVHSVIFSQAMAITHSMIELGCSKTQTREFLHRICVRHELSERQRQDLLKHLMSR